MGVSRFVTTFSGAGKGVTDAQPTIGVPKFPYLDLKLPYLLVQASRTDRERRATSAAMLASTPNSPCCCGRRRVCKEIEGLCTKANGVIYPQRTGERSLERV